MQELLKQMESQQRDYSSDRQSLSRQLLTAIQSQEVVTDVPAALNNIPGLSSSTSSITATAAAAVTGGGGGAGGQQQQQRGLVFDSMSLLLLQQQQQGQQQGQQQNMQHQQQATHQSNQQQMSLNQHLIQQHHPPVRNMNFCKFAICSVWRRLFSADNFTTTEFLKYTKHKTLQGLKK
jgi:membrane protease subunit (stomatin/prohibitin family)